MKLTLFEVVLFQNIVLDREIKEAKKGDKFLATKCKDLSEKLQKEEKKLRKEQEEDSSEQESSDDSLEDEPSEDEDSSDNVTSDEEKIEFVWAMAKHTKSAKDTAEEICRLYIECDELTENEILSWFIDKLPEGKQKTFLKWLSLSIQKSDEDKATDIFNYAKTHNFTETSQLIKQAYPEDKLAGTSDLKTCRYFAENHLEDREDQIKFYRSLDMKR